MWGVLWHEPQAKNVTLCGLLLFFSAFMLNLLFSMFVKVNYSVYR